MYQTVESNTGHCFGFDKSEKIVTSALKICPFVCVDYLYILVYYILDRCRYSTGYVQESFLVNCHNLRTLN